MAAARYWRLVGIETYGGGALELSALQLYDAASVRVDAVATLTCSHAPSAGTLGALQDGDLATACSFSSDAVRASGFWLRWDFGAGTADVHVLRAGGGATKALFLARFILQSSADSTQWTTQLSSAIAISWPGVSVLSAAPGNPYFDDVSLLLKLDGANGSNTFTDSSLRSKTVTAYGDARISTAQSKFGGASLETPSAGSYLHVGNHEDFDFGSGDFTIQMFVYPTSTSGLGALIGYANGSAQNSNYAFQLLRNGSQWQFDTFVGATQYGGAAGSVTPNAWVHAELARYGTNLLAFIGGALIKTTPISTLSLNSPAGAVLQIGQVQGFYHWSGFIDQVEITKGRALHTAPFTPPAQPAYDYFSGDVFARTSARSHSSIAASAAVDAHRTSAAGALMLVRDVEFGGPGAIYGTTKTKGSPNIPAKARVVLQHQRSKLPVRETWSDPVTGYFEFRGIDTNQQFLTLAEDVDGNFRPVAANRLTPEVLA